MPFCSSCGSQVAEGVAFCPSCGAPMQRAAPPPQAPPAAPQYPGGGYGQPAYPPPGYAPPPGQYPPGYAPYPGYGPMPGEKSVGLAFFLSLLLTGLGQLYNHEISKGIIFLIVGLLLWPLDFFTGFLLCVVHIPFWIYGMYDAYSRANQYNQALRATGRPPW